MIGADEAAEAAKGASVVGSFGTIITLWLMSNVVVVCVMAHWSTQRCEAPVMNRNDDPYGFHKNQPWSGANAQLYPQKTGTIEIGLLDDTETSWCVLGKHSVKNDVKNDAKNDVRRIQNGNRNDSSKTTTMISATQDDSMFSLRRLYLTATTRDRQT